MADFKEFIEGFEEKPEEVKKPNRPKHYIKSFSDKPIFPMTKTDYVKKGSKWSPVNTEESKISQNQTKMVLAEEGLPFEKSHSHKKRDRFGHMEKYDTFSSIAPDGQRKTTWFVDFAKGNENMHKAVNKSYYDRMRYKKKKEANKGE